MDHFLNRFVAFLILITALTVISCESEEQESREVVEGYYLGTLTVEQNAGSVYIQDSVRIRMLPEESGQNVGVIMYSVKFSPRMPISLDVTIPSVFWQVDNDIIYLSGDSIIPLAMGGEYPIYIITDLTGNVDKQNNLVLNMNCGTYPLSYFGQLYTAGQ